MHEIPHGQILAQCLAKLGTDPDQLLGYDVLTGGASGAYSYRLRFPSGDQFLKVTQPGCPEPLLARAHREILFYRHLASNVQVKVPKAIAHRCDSSSGACLLLEAYEPSPEPVAWIESRYIQVAEQLGRFHAKFWGKEHELSTFGWLRRVEAVEAADVLQAHTYWDRLLSHERFETILTPERHAWALGMLDCIRNAGSALSSFPVTLCHGDFHIDNILVDPNAGMVFADWQEVGTGYGPEDLSFFFQRASFSGGTVPCEEMIGAYQQCLTTHTDAHVPVWAIRRIVDVAELRTRLLHWPAFLTGGSEHQLTDLLSRIETLAARLETTVACSS